MTGLDVGAWIILVGPVVLWCAFFGGIAGSLARRKHRDVIGWFLLGCVTGPLAWIVAAFEALVVPEELSIPRSRVVNAPGSRRVE